MRKSRTHYTKTDRPVAAPVLLCLLSGLLFSKNTKAQSCPFNIDFETGSFAGWTCYSGSVFATTNSNVISLTPTSGPIANQHTMYSAAQVGGFTDPYGGFPVICPNGSNYSVKLGNNSGGAQAEGLSYEFTIPSNRNTYALIYHYAVVFQDPNHLPFQQPRLELEITNVTDNQVIGCSSFTFFPNGSPLPGFYPSPLSDSTTVWCKSWSAVTVNLNGQAGKTIKLLFKTADCTFQRHFGYAYIDVNSECSSEFTGATFCPDDTAVNVTAPYGYQNYNWYDNSYNLLGTQQVITFTPPPPPGTVIAVELIPYDGYGCLDTLYARLVDTLTLQANAGADALSCNKSPVVIGGISKPGVVYSWDPPTDLSDPNVANPRAGPDITTRYVLTIRSLGGGCVSTDTVWVTASTIDSSLQVIGKPAFCITTGDSAVLLVQPNNSIQWFSNNNAISGANQPSYKVTQSGIYHALLTNTDGCSLTTRSEEIIVETPRIGIMYPVEYALINEPIVLQARTFGASVLWKPTIYLDEPTSVTPVFKAPALLDQFYTIDITTTSGCVTADTLIVKTIKEVKIYVPTAFTPNNDGRNDFLKPILIGIKELQYFRIYNRWGQVIYEMKSPQKGWDGTIGGILQQTGVYVYVVQGTGLDKRTYLQKGTTVLIR